MTIEKVVCRKLYRKWRKVGTSFANERRSDSERYIKENENVCGKNQGGSDICKPFFWEYFFPFLSRMNCDIALKKCLITLSSTLFQIWFKFLHINQFFMNQSLGQIMPPPQIFRPSTTPGLMFNGFGKLSASLEMIQKLDLGQCILRS